MENYTLLSNFDDSNTIYIPKEYREFLGWKAEDNIFICIEDEKLFIKKFNNICIICKNLFNSNKPKFNICHKCIADIIKYNNKF